MKVEPEHDCVPHETVVAASWQAPAPLHAPVLPQGGFAAQRLSGVAERRDGAVARARTDVARLAQAHELVLQQTPSTQKLPVRHSLVFAHAWPRRFLLPQRLVCGSQMLGGRQSSSPVQAPRHAVVPLQT